MNKTPKIIGGKKPLSFAGIFALVVIAEYLVFYEFAPPLFVDGLARLNAAIVHFLVALTGANAALSGDTIVFPNMNLRIVYECTGGFEMFIFSACVIAFPSNLRSKIWGHIFGVVGVFIINIARLLVLSWAALHAQSAFDFIHKYLWQATFIILVLLLWVVWINVFASGKQKGIAPPKPKKKSK